MVIENFDPFVREELEEVDRHIIFLHHILCGKKYFDV